MDESFLRMRGARKSPRTSNSEWGEQVTNDSIDYSNALIYLAGIQLVTATVTSSLVAILGCTMVPTSLVSAVRTLTLTMATASAFVYQPLRIGRVKGLDIVFAALRPCVFVYIASLILEQLIHSCARDAAAPSWRRILVHAGSFVQLMAGFLRAKNPTSETDLPFLLVLASLVLVAMLPPPAVILQGPLCNSPSLWTASERLLRAFCFSMLYCILVFCSNLPNRATNELLLCVCRAASASIWVLACHPYLLILAIPQGVFAVYFRIKAYEKLKVDNDDPEVGTRLLDSEEDPVEETSKSATESFRSTPPPPSQHSQHGQHAATDGGVIRPSFSGFGARPLVDISQANGDVAAGGGGTHPGDLSREELARIAESM